MTTKECAPIEFQYKQLQELEKEINWAKLVQLVAHHYVESDIGQLHVSVETMIRIYFLQLRYNLNSSEVSIVLSKIDFLRGFTLINIKTDVIPEEISVDKFRSLIKLKELDDQFEAEFSINPILES